tara:strand:+ start:768 stop:1403 length:636 start_codon:yes stop_codon:yes gene_type:complete
MNYDFILILFISIICYLIGSIPFGLILTKLKGLKDLRTIGSGNIGATNVLRTGNKKLALLTLILDFSKSYIPLLIILKILKIPFFLTITSNLYLDQFSMILIFGYFSIIGHCYPIWLKFKGGKGVATSLGVIFLLDPLIGVLLLAIWILIFYIFKISSLSALIASICFPVLIFLKYENVNLIFLTIFLTIFVFFTHRENIKRILKQEEKKI